VRGSVHGHSQRQPDRKEKLRHEWLRSSLRLSYVSSRQNLFSCFIYFFDTIPVLSLTTALDLTTVPFCLPVACLSTAPDLCRSINEPIASQGQVGGLTTRLDLPAFASQALTNVFSRDRGPVRHAAPSLSRRTPTHRHTPVALSHRQHTHIHPRHMHRHTQTRLGPPAPCTRPSTAPTPLPPPPPPPPPPTGAPVSPRGWAAASEPA
jgi:hypothetical protein